MNNRKREIIHRIFKYISIAFAVYLVGFFTWALYIDYKTDLYVDSYMWRAAVATEANNMLVDLESAEAGMNYYEYEEGYRALIYKNEGTDIARDREILDSLQYRVKLIANLDADSVEYQTGMADLRGIINEFYYSVGDYYFLNLHARWTWLALLSIPMLIITLIGFVWTLDW